MNFLKFGRLTPNCVQLLSIEKCQESHNFSIGHALSERGKKIPRETLLKPWDYFSFWKIQLEAGIFGIFGHRTLYKQAHELLFYNVFIFLALTSLLRFIWFKENTLVIISTILAIVYFLIAFRTNYNTYFQTGYLTYGIQGRYLFAIAPLLVYLLVYYLSKIPGGTIRVIVFSLLIILFFWGDLPFFIQHADKGWYIGKGQEAWDVNLYADQLLSSQKEFAAQLSPSP